MQKITIIKILLFLLISQSVWAAYTVKLESRGIFYHQGSKPSTILEAQLCDGDICYFVSTFENDLLNLDLGDNRAEIYQTLTKMSTLELTFIFYRLHQLEYEYESGRFNW